jgi:hypothetical protein
VFRYGDGTNEKTKQKQQTRSRVPKERTRNQNCFCLANACPALATAAVGLLCLRYSLSVSLFGVLRPLQIKQARKGSEKNVSLCACECVCVIGASLAGGFCRFV